MEDLNPEHQSEFHGRYMTRLALELIPVRLYTPAFVQNLERSSLTYLT